MGFTSECEIVDIWLDSDLPLESIQDALVSASPPGIMIKRIEQVANDLPALQASLVAADYLITFLDSMPHIFQEIDQLLGATSVPRIRRNAGNIIIAIGRRGNSLEIDIQDNGKRFYPSDKQKSGYGILFTKERIAYLKKLYKKEKITYNLVHADSGTSVRFFFKNWMV